MTFSDTQNIPVIFMSKGESDKVSLVFQLDYAARAKSPEKAAKAYAEASALLDQVVAAM